VFDSRSGLDADFVRAEAMVKEKSSSTSSAIALNLGGAAVPIKEVDFAVSIRTARADVQPTIGANAGVAIADGACDIGQRDTRWDAGHRSQQKIILRAVRFQV
jgi:hypothetical protein